MYEIMQTKKPKVVWHRLVMRDRRLSTKTQSCWTKIHWLLPLD